MNNEESYLVRFMLCKEPMTGVEGEAPGARN